MGKCHSEPNPIQKSSLETWKEWEHQGKVTVVWLRDKHSRTQTLEMEKADFKEVREKRFRILWIATLQGRPTQEKWEALPYLAMTLVALLDSSALDPGPISVAY